MDKSTRQATYQQRLGAIHRLLCMASADAEQLGDFGAEHDLDALSAHVRTMLNESLHRHRHQPVNQLTVPDA